MSYKIRIVKEEQNPKEDGYNRTIDTEVYEQRVDEIDIPAIVAIVNGIKIQEKK